MLKSFRQRTQESERIYRCRSNTVAAAIWLVISNGFAISFIIRAPDSPSIIILAVLYGIASTLVLVRLMWAGIFTSSEGVHIANVFESFDLQWREIQRFEMGRWKVIPRTCLIYLRDGRVKHAAGVEESVNFPKGDAERMVNDLNDQLSQRLGRSTLARV